MTSEQPRAGRVRSLNTTRDHGRLCSLLLALLLVCTWRVTVDAATVTVFWNQNPETDIAGYKLSYGTQSRTYTTTIDVGQTTSTSVSGLNSGQTYYFAVQAYDTSGLISSYSTEVAFTVPGVPTITGLSPASGNVGTPVTVTGTNFGATQNASTITFNGTSATPTSWSPTSITAPVPSGAASGTIVVTVDGMASNGAAFTVVTSATPTITSLSPTSGAVGTSVTITGTNFGANQGTSTVAFNGTGAAPTSWSATSITVPVPTGASTGNVVVKVGGVSSNGVPFTVTTTTTAPTIASVTPASGPIGTTVTVAGTGFGSAPAAGAIGIDATASVNVSTSAATVTVPAFSTTAANELLLAFVATDYSSGANTSVTSVSGAGLTWQLVQRANVQAGTSEIWRAFAATTVSNASIMATLSQSVAASMTVMSFDGVDISGTNGSGAIGAAASANASPGAPTATLTTTRNNSLVVGVGNDFYSATARTLGPNQVLVHQDLQNSGAVDTFWVQRTSGTIGTTGTPVTLNDVSPSTDAYNFAICEVLAAATSTSTITFNGTAGAPTSWSDTNITVPAPTGATTGDVVVGAGGAESNGVLFTVTTSTASAPMITNVTPGSGSVGTVVTITGSNFGATQGTSVVAFNGTVARPTSWSDTSISVPVPTGAKTGNVAVSVGGTASNGAAFTVVAPFTFQQVNYGTPSTAETVTVAYNAAQIAGDTNIVVVGWSDTTMSVQSVTDAMGNHYRVAVGPTLQSSVATQVIYIATGIAAAAPAANLVTITFTGAARLPDVRIAEYGGIDAQNPIDATATGQGRGSIATSGTLTTTNGADLIVAADLARATTTGAGSQYISRVITSPNGDIVEDRAVTTAGSYRATAPLSASARWLIQAVAFRAAVIR